jgi:hypothetical protein
MEDSQVKIQVQMWALVLGRMQELELVQMPEMGQERFLGLVLAPFVVLEQILELV